MSTTTEPLEAEMSAPTLYPVDGAAPRVVVRLATEFRPAAAWVGLPTGVEDEEDTEVLMEVTEYRVEDGSVVAHRAPQDGLALPAASEDGWVVDSEYHRVGLVAAWAGQRQEQAAEARDAAWDAWSAERAREERFAAWA